MPPLLTRSEFNEQHVKDVCSCLLRRVIERIGCKETPMSFVRHRNWIIGASADG